MKSKFERIHLRSISNVCKSSVEKMVGGFWSVIVHTFLAHNKLLCKTIIILLRLYASCGPTFKKSLLSTYFFIAKYTNWFFIFSEVNVLNCLLIVLLSL